MEVQIQNELNELIEVIKEKNGEAFWPGSVIPPSVINVLWTFTAGKKIPRSDERLMRLLTLMQQRSKAFDMSGGWLNSMPFLRFIAPEMTSYNLIKRFNLELCELFRGIIDAHKAEFTEDKADDDLIYAFINEMKLREGSPSNFNDLQLTMIILDMFIAGSQTTSITLDLALMMMVVRPDIQAKVHRDIDEVLGEAQLPLLSDKSKLSYIEAVLLEVGRLVFFAIHLLHISILTLVASSQTDISTSYPHRGLDACSKQPLSVDTQSRKIPPFSLACIPFRRTSPIGTIRMSFGRNDFWTKMEK